MTQVQGLVLNEAEIEKLLNRTYPPSLAFSALEKERLSIEDFAAIILSDDSDNVFFEKLASRAKEVTKARFGLVKGLYIPLYLSSSCHNVCSYCGFRRDNKIKRTTLSVEEVRKELDAIYKKGFSHILLVSGELKGFSNSAYLADCVSAAREAGFHSISVELGALDEKSASTLAKAGSQCFVLYQETYHRETYNKVHLDGLKKDYSYRLGGAERALKAGFRQIALGYLTGLYNPMYEALSLFEHLSYLKKRYWEAEYAVSFPRMNGAVGLSGNFDKVSDRKFAKILMAFRLAFPESPINLSTRESPAFRDGMANICATHLSVESKTHPGGYLDESGEELEQFDVHDGRSLREMTEALRKMGYDIYFKDWEMELNKI